MAKKLLLAEDSLTIQKVFSLTFQKSDISLTTVDNGEDAVRLAGEISPDLVVADVTLADRSGFEVAEALRGAEKTRSCPILILAGSLPPFDEEKFRQCGADAVLFKPFESQELIDKVDMLLREGEVQVGAAAAESEAGGGEVWDFSDVLEEVEEEVGKPASPAKAAAALLPEDAGSTSRGEELRSLGEFDVSLEDIVREAGGPELLTAEEMSGDGDPTVSEAVGERLTGDGDPTVPEAVGERLTGDGDPTVSEAVGERLTGDGDPTVPEVVAEGLTGDGIESIAEELPLLDLQAEDPGLEVSPAAGEGMLPTEDVWEVSEEWAERDTADPVAEPPVQSVPPMEASLESMPEHVLETTPFVPPDPSVAELTAVPEMALLAEGRDVAEDATAAESFAPADARNREEFSDRVREILEKVAAETVEKVMWEMMERLSGEIRQQIREAVEAVAWDVIPATAETLIREEIERIRGKAAE